MPNNLVKTLDKKASKLIHYRTLFKNEQIFLERAETSFKLFNSFRDKIFENAPRLYETKGLVAGLKKIQECVRIHQEFIKKEIEEERMDPEIGKPILKELHKVVLTSLSKADEKREELIKFSGELVGYYNSASSVLDNIQDVINNYKRSLEIEEEDNEWRKNYIKKPEKKKKATKKSSKKKNNVKKKV